MMIPRSVSCTQCWNVCAMCVCSHLTTGSIPGVFAFSCGCKLRCVHLKIWLTGLCQGGCDGAAGEVVDKNPPGAVSFLCQKLQAVGTRHDARKINLTISYLPLLSQPKQHNTAAGIMQTNKVTPMSANHKQPQVPGSSYICSNYLTISVRWIEPRERKRKRERERKKAQGKTMEVMSTVPLTKDLLASRDIRILRLFCLFGPWFSVYQGMGD